MTKKVVVFGHADADGHVIAEQMRSNLSAVSSFSVEVVVDPVRTKGHTAWLSVSDLHEAESADIVFFVDLMFSPKNFDQEARSLTSWIGQYPDKKFFLIDHHPIPISRLASAPNLRAIYRPDVFECAIGPRSGLMILAALDEKQKHLVEAICQPYHEAIARGLRRAAAKGSGMAGAPLMSLIRAGCWNELAELGTDDAAFHRLVRGVRPRGDETSALFDAVKAKALRLAEEMFKGTSYLQSESKEQLLAYDVANERYNGKIGAGIRLYSNSVAQSTDLEAIVTLLEMAAISLTESPDTTFTKERLLEEAQELAGGGFKLERRDVDIVLEKAAFLEKKRGVLSLRV